MTAARGRRADAAASSHAWRWTGAASDALFRRLLLERAVQDPDLPFVALIDGDCGLCRATERWVKKRDKHGRFVFHPLESAEGQEWLQRVGLPLETRDTMVLIEGDRTFLRSTAVLRMVRRLRAAWPLAYGLIAVPRPLRDWGYRFVARHRRHIRIGGGTGSESCAVPTQRERKM